MPMSQPEMERRIVRNTNDIESIYELLTGIDGRLTGIDGRLDGIDGRLDRIDGRLESLDGNVAEVLRRLPG